MQAQGLIRRAAKLSERQQKQDRICVRFYGALVLQGGCVLSTPNHTLLAMLLETRTIRSTHTCRILCWGRNFGANQPGVQSAEATHCQHMHECMPPTLHVEHGLCINTRRDLCASAQHMLARRSMCCDWCTRAPAFAFACTVLQT